MGAMVRVDRRPGRDRGSVSRETGNTWDELNALMQWLKAQGKHRVIIVTSKSHTRRLTWMWSHVQDSTVTGVVRWAASDPFNPSQTWWQDRRLAFIVLWEYLGLMNYWLGFPL